MGILRYTDNERSTLINVIWALSAVELFSWALAAFHVDISMTREGWFSPLVALGYVAGAATLIGLWCQQKWSLYLYAAVVFCSQLALFLLDAWGPASAYAPAAALAVLYSERASFV